MIKHGWNTLDNYLVVHKRVLANFAKHMIKERTWNIDRVTDRYMEMRAEGILFQTFNGNTVRVDPTNLKRERAKTFDYTYSVNIPGENYLFRYCSPHMDVGNIFPDHHKYHHKHIFKDSKEIVLKQPDDQWPHVNGVPPRGSRDLLKIKNINFC